MAASRSRSLSIPGWVLSGVIPLFELTPSEGMVLVLYAAKLGKERGFCSDEFIANRTGLSTRTIQAARRKLAELELIILVEEPRRGRAGVYEMPKRPPRRLPKNMLDFPTRGAEWDEDANGMIATS